MDTLKKNVDYDLKSTNPKKGHHFSKWKNDCPDDMDIKPADKGVETFN